MFNGGYAVAWVSTWQKYTRSEASVSSTFQQGSADLYPDFYGKLNPSRVEYK